MTTPSACPECGATVRGVDLATGTHGVGQNGETPDADAFVFRPCGHPAVEATE